MGKSEKQFYLRAIRNRYHKSNRANKDKIQDEFCAVCNYKRKRALRRLNSSSGKKQRKKPGRLSTYADPRSLLRV